MSRNNTLLLSLAFLALVCFQSGASSLFDAFSSRDTIMNAYAGSSGTVDLKKDTAYSNDAFYVEADLYSYPSSSSTVPGTVKMMLSIVNDETMVATSCMYFNSYNCAQSQYGCYNYGWDKTIVFPSFTAQTKTAQSTIYLDYSYWRLSQAYLYIAQSCQSNDYSSNIGLNRYGVLGMGTTGSSKNDFSSSKVFSFVIPSDLSKGTLLFQNAASTYAQSTSAIHSIYTNTTWQYSFSSGYISVSGNSASFGSGNLMFDINSDVIGLPYSYFTSLVSYFTYSVGVISCNSDSYRPVCYSTKKIQDLPDITISVGSFALRIPSAIYATLIGEGSRTSFYFNLKATNPSMSGKSYITPAFQNSIILGSRFMSYYYVVFDASSNYNYIYIYNSKSASPTSPAALIAAGVAGIVFLVGLCCCIAKKKRSAPTTTTGVNNVTTDAFNYTQAPLVYNQQVPVTVPDYTYNANAYNYAQQPQGMYPTYNAGYQQPQGGVYNTGYVQPTGAYPQ